LHKKRRRIYISAGWFSVPSSEEEEEKERAKLRCLLTLGQLVGNASKIDEEEERKRMEKG